MIEWIECTIGDLCDTVSDTYRGNDENVILVNTSDVLEGKVLNHTQVPNKNLKGQFKKTFRKNDILFSEIRPANKRFAFIDFEDTSNYIASTKLMVLRHNEKVLPEYLFAILKSNYILAELQHLAETRSGTFPQITFSSELAPMKVNLPDKKTQKQIVSILSSIEQKMDTNEIINNNLLEQAKTLYKDWFFDFSPFSTDGSIPYDWRMGTVGDIIQLYDSKRVPLSGAKRDRMEKLYPYYGATSLMDYVDNYLFNGIFLLLGEDGTVVDSLGFPILQYVYGKFWVNNHAHVITGKEGFSVEELFLFFSLTNINTIVTGAVQQKVSQQNLKKVPAIIPTKEVLSAFDNIIQPIFAQIRTLRDENLYLADLRDVLLPKLMSGELDVSDIDF
jgi:type I restriction enzyme S subunit